MIQTVISSSDKDLQMIPGLHYNELKPERGIYEISEQDALRNFYIQLLCGDPTDNIPGLYGVGRSSQLLRKLQSLSDELDMYSHVREQYEKRFGSYWKQFLWENAALLWIKRQHLPEAGNEILERLKKMENILTPPPNPTVVDLRKDLFDLWPQHQKDTYYTQSGSIAQ